MPRERSLLSRDPVAVTVGGVRFFLPHRPAAVWAQGVTQVEMLAAVLADEEQREVLADLLMDVPGTVAEMRSESLRILSACTGFRWWEAGRLINTSVSGETLGRLVLAGVGAHACTIGEWCAAVYALCVKGADEKERIRFDFSLSLPPPGFEDEWDDDAQDPAEVQAALSQITGKK